MYVLNLELEHLARARQRGLEREAALELLLKRAKAEEPAPERREEPGAVARFLANVAAHV